MQNRTPSPKRARLRLLLLVPLCLLLTALCLLPLLTAGGASQAVPSLNVDIIGTYERNLNNLVSSTLEGIVPIPRLYELSDSDMVAPVPNPACFGQTQEPQDMAAILEQAAPLLDGQSTLFTTETPIKPGSTIHYYLDETILAITWKQSLNKSTYTFSEVKIAHASQMRRFLSGGKYNSGILNTTTNMARSVNAVVASSGDFYEYRTIGIVVNQGQVYRHMGHFLDTCYIDENGDLLFTYAGDFTTREPIQDFVEEHNVRFSLSFGPVLLLDGEYRVPQKYNSGEIRSRYPRAALCQMDSLHYVLAVANKEDPDYVVPRMAQFAQELQNMGIPTAYALDGGQTAAIAMNNELISPVSYKSEREISDILYFATALPESEWEEQP